MVDKEAILPKSKNSRERSNSTKAKMVEKEQFYQSKNCRERSNSTKE